MLNIHVQKCKHNLHIPTDILKEYAEHMHMSCLSPLTVENKSNKAQSLNPRLNSNQELIFHCICQ